MKAGGRVVHIGSSMTHYAAFLASPEAAFVTGADIIADGGFTA